MSDAPPSTPKNTKAKKPLWLRIALWSLAGVLLLAAYPAVTIGRYVLFPPTYDVKPIQEAAAYQDAKLLEKAWALPVAATYKGTLAYQSNGSTCGPTSLSDVERS